MKTRRAVTGQLFDLTVGPGEPVSTATCPVEAGPAVEAGNTFGTLRVVVRDNVPRGTVRSAPAVVANLGPRSLVAVVVTSSASVGAQAVLAAPRTEIAGSARRKDRIGGGGQLGHRVLTQLPGEAV